MDLVSPSTAGRSPRAHTLTRRPERPSFEGFFATGSTMGGIGASNSTKRAERMSNGDLQGS